jgi:hypothetical protein
LDTCRNERVAALPQAVAPARKRESKPIAPNVRNAGAFAPKTPTPCGKPSNRKHQYILKDFREAQDEAKVQIISAWAANQDFLQHQFDEQYEAYHVALERREL